MKKEIKLFATDIDGVWTDAGMYYDQTGNEWKKFNTKDSAGVNFLRTLGIEIAILTGEKTTIVENRAKKLKIDKCYQGLSDKLTVLKGIVKDMGISLEEVAYIGDDLNDVEVLKAVGISCCPNDASDYIKNLVDYVSIKNGGQGCFRDFVEKYLTENGLLDNVLKNYGI